MCNLCEQTKRQMKRKKRYNKKNSIGAVKTAKMITQLAGVGGAATAASTDAIWTKIEFLKDEPIKVAAAKGLIGWILSNNPMENAALENENLQEFGSGMMYYSWGQMVNYALKLESYVNKSVAGIETPEEMPEPSPNFIGADYYEMLAAEMESGENAELSGTTAPTEPAAVQNKLML
jgi:hypothetical protein